MSLRHSQHDGQGRSITINNNSSNTSAGEKTRAHGKAMAMTSTTSFDAAVVMNRSRAQSEAIAMMESPSRDGDSEWAPLSDFHGEPLESTTHAGGTMSSLLGAPPISLSVSGDLHNTRIVDSKLAREADLKITMNQSSHRPFNNGILNSNANSGGSSISLSITSAVNTNTGGDAAVKADAEVTLLNRKHIGLLVSVALASLLSTWLKRGVLPLMQIELEMKQYQVDAAELLLLVPWSCSFVLGFCSDIFPIFGSHWKAYMMIGWVLSASSLATMAILNHSKDFHTKISNHDDSIDEEDKKAIVGGYVFLLGAACFGEILSIMMAEIYVIAFSKREALEQRGHLVGTFLLVQFGFQVIGQVITDTTIFNMKADGSLDPHVSFQDSVLYVAFYSLLPIPIIFYLFDDHLDDNYEDDTMTGTNSTSDSHADSGGDSILLVNSDDECGMLQEPQQHKQKLTQSQQQYQLQLQQRAGQTGSLMALWIKFKSHWQLLWGALAEKATWQIVCFLCVFIFFSEFTLRYPFLVLDQWSGVTAKTISTGKIFTEVMFFLAVLVWKCLCVNAKWGTYVICSYLGVFIFPPMTYFLLVTFSVGMNLELYTFVSSFQGFIRALAVLLEVVMMVEIAPKGGEGAVLGTIVSIAAIMRLISQTFSNSIGYLFGTQLLLTNKGSATAIGSTHAADTSTDDEPMLVATALLLCFTLRLFALLGVVFLPSQKLALRKLQLVGGRRSFRAWWTLGILVISLLMGTLLNTLVLTPDTTCLHALGGNGCDSTG